MSTQRGDAATEHLGDGEFRARLDERRIHQFGFQRPDALAQPRLQQHVLAGATQQRHGRVPVGVDQARGQDAIGKSQVLPGRITFEQRRCRADGDDPFTLQTDPAVAQRPVLRSDRQHVGGLDVGVAGDLLHGRDYTRRASIAGFSRPGPLTRT